jgi:TRAP-type mannitol/chloroaromatic compound transport system permease small subunit
VEAGKEDWRNKVAMLGKLVTGIDALNDWLGRWVSFCVIPISALVLFEVVCRYLFNSPTVWANEMTQMLFGAYVILSGGYIMRWGGHVNVDILYSRLSDKTRAVMDIATSFLFFLFVGMMAVYGGSLAWESLSMLERSESAWNPPIYPVKLTIPLGCILLLLQGLTTLIRNIMILVNGDNIAVAATGEKETL